MPAVQEEDVLIYSINDNGLKHSNGLWLTAFVAFIRAVSVSQMIWRRVQIVFNFIKIK